MIIIPFLLLVLTVFAIAKHFDNKNKNLKFEKEIKANDPKKFNKKYTGKIDFVDFKCKQDERGFYYLLSYDENKDFIIAFKNDDNSLIFEKVVVNVANNLKLFLPTNTHIVLTSVPYSKKGLVSSINKVIQKITQKKLLNVDLSEYFFLDGTDIFSYQENIANTEKFKEDKRQVAKRNVNAISCDTRFNSNLYYVILDDVATTGTSLLGCKQKLICQGVPEKNIICFALAKTEFDDCVSDEKLYFNNIIKTRYASKRVDLFIDKKQTDVQINPNRVKIGDKVTFYYNDRPDEIKTYQIVPIIPPTSEAEEKIYSGTPLGQSLLGSVEEDIVELKFDDREDRYITIMKIEK